MMRRFKAEYLLVMKRSNYIAHSQDFSVNMLGIVYYSPFLTILPGVVVQFSPLLV